MKFSAYNYLCICCLAVLLSMQAIGQQNGQNRYDIAAFVWPAYQPDGRAKLFWPEGIGEWQSVKNDRPKKNHRPRKPLWGYVNEADPYVSEMEINAAADHGVNVFIFDWYWFGGMPFLEGQLNNGYLKAHNNNRVQFYLMWANHDANLTWDKRNAGKNNDATIWKGSVDRHEFEIICHRVIDQYFSKPSYYKINGKPSFMIYDLNNLIRGLGGVAQTKAALDWFRAATKKAGFRGLDLQLTLRSRGTNVSGIAGDQIGTQAEVVKRLNFDGVTHYQFAHFTNIDRDYNEIMESVKAEWKEVAGTYNIPYYPHVSVGWDNNPRFEMYRPGIVKNNTPENFKKALSLAKNYVDAHPDQQPLITINSWNEWTETSYLEPDDLYGYGYLDAIQSVFRSQDHLGKKADKRQ